METEDNNEQTLKQENTEATASQDTTLSNDEDSIILQREYTEPTTGQILTFEVEFFFSKKKMIEVIKRLREEHERGKPHAITHKGDIPSIKTSKAAISFSE